MSFESTNTNNKKFRFAIDRGGTFTDVFAICPSGKIVTMKLLSENLSSYPDAPTEAIKRIIEKETGYKTTDNLIDPDYIEWIRMGTTVATNALLESKGSKFCLVITKGFKDLLYIGNQTRPNLFDLTIKMPNILYEDAIEVEERVVPYTEGKEINKNNRVVETRNKEKVEIVTELNLKDLEEKLIALKTKTTIRNLAIILTHSYIYHEHEIKIRDLAVRLGFEHISLSHEVMPTIRMVPRGLTTCIDAYLTPCIKQYINNFISNFKREDVNVLFMQSDGGLTSLNNFTGSRAILSGPAGGVVGYALTHYNQETNEPIIGFDMGGTSTDVSRYAGTYEHVFESITAGYLIQAPQLDVNTVAAGGGSILFFQSGLFAVGPDSASSNPGPACYKKGGPLTITDANLLLGRLIPDYFPKIFGPNENEPLDLNITKQKFGVLSDEVINKFLTLNGSQNLNVEEIAYGYIKVANEAMCRPIRNLTESKGYDTSKHNLVCFGGAGGQHACAIAKSLGIKKVYINRFAGILSAYGMALADVVCEQQEPCFKELDDNLMENYIAERLTHLKNLCKDYLVLKEGFTENNIHYEIYLNIRYQGTDTSLMCSPRNRAQESNFNSLHFTETFLERYRNEFGFTMPDRRLIVDDIRVRAIAKTGITPKMLHIRTRKEETGIKVGAVKKVYFDSSYVDTSIYFIEDLYTDDKLFGPAIIIDSNCTIIIEPKCEATLNKYGDIEITIAKCENINQFLNDKVDRIQLSIFSHRFMSIAEQMGRILQRTSISTNIKERLDFSCAMFDFNGGLVANAPHIPVHLGAMQEAVKYQINYYSQNINGNLEDGDVILVNHPSCGGSHLPDLTIITPVFSKYSAKPVFFVANRGHHADIGGLTPGSMPPNSTSLWQEGASFKSFKVVKSGVFQEKELIDALNEPIKYPGCSGTRALNDNISDLKAQIAANKKGIELINQLITEYGLDTVQSYMMHIQDTAEEAVRKLMIQICSERESNNINEGFVDFYAQEFMDDGSNIDLKIKINKKDGEAVFDFSGTGYQTNNNCNAPKAITYSAIIYCLRCMLKYDIPLNQGCLKPIKIIIEDGSLLSPSEDAAVVGGNVLTSQRIVDVVLKAFKVCAASQGCMNNITFGNDKMSYYETVGGGAGAGPNWNGRSGVHTHMTNTRITDVEIFETRYPVVLNQFSLRKHSGGIGKYNGGDGLIREFVFRTAMTLCVLTERRVFQPYGLMGGCGGAKGLNTLIKANGRRINLGSKSSVNVEYGDAFLLLTPGGGGYGCDKLKNHTDSNENNNFSIDNIKTKGSLGLYKHIQETS